MLLKHRNKKKTWYLLLNITGDVDVRNIQQIVTAVAVLKNFDKQNATAVP